MGNPEINNNSPSPENPNNGFSIEVQNPDKIYEYISEKFANIKNYDPFDFKIGDPFNITLGKTIVIDNLVRHFKLDIIKDKQNTNEINSKFSFNFEIKKEVKFEKGEDRGHFDENIRYISEERVREMIKYMGKFGESAEYDTNMIGEQIVKIKKNNQLYLTNFGFPNFEIHDLLKKMTAQNYLKKIYSCVLASREIEIYLGDNKDFSQKYKNHYILLDNEKDFKTKLTDFCGICELVTNCFYNSFQEKPLKKKFIIDCGFEEKELNQEENKKYLEPDVIKKEEENKEIIISLDKTNLPEHGFNSIAGQDRAVAEAKKLVLAINHPEIYEKRGVKTPKGILFYGPPGTGKTLIAKAIASEVNAELFEVSFSDIGSKWYGESEQRIQEVFDNANKVTKTGKKAIILFDELDSMAPSRMDSYEGSKKIVSIILQNLDGFRSNKNVLILGTTNRPEDIDPALKRPGRIDKIIPVELPDLEGRKAILKLHINKAKENASDSHDLFSSDLNIQKIAENTNGMSGADLANIINLTLETKTVLELEGLRWTPISNQDIENTLTEFDLKKKEKNKIGFNL